MKRCVVTGGAGFIGSCFLRHALKKYDCEFLCIDSLTYSGDKRHVDEFCKLKNFSFLNGNICDSDVVRAIKKDDIVVNFAAETHVDNSITGSGVFIDTNIIGTHNLLEVCREKEAALFVQVSTDEVYGSLKLDQRSSREGDVFRPSSPYSASKASAEMLCMANFVTYDQPILITRSSNNFGPYQFPEKLVPLFVSNLIEGKKLPVYGTGENIRDWLFVQDNCEGIEYVIQNGKLGEVYNVGGGNEIRNISFTKLILEIMGKDESCIEYVKDRPGHDVRYSLDCSKVEKLGWTPRFTFEDALKETVEWYKNNESWWKSLKKRLK